MTSQWFENKNHFFYIILLISISTLFFVFGNNIVSLTHPDEVFYIQSAKEMIAHQSYLTPYIFDQPQFEKPILSYWLFVAAIKMMGLNPFAARFFPSLFALIGVLTVYWLSFRMFHKKQTAFVAALILSTSMIYLGMARAVLTDMIFSVIVLLAMTFFYIGIEDKNKSFNWMVGGFVLTAMAVLTKGVLGILFPLGTMFIYLIFTKRVQIVFEYRSLIGLLICALLIIPWHWLMIKQYGSNFIQEYWGNVHVRRILEAEHKRLDHWHFYPTLMFAGMLPWSFFWIVVFAGIKEELFKARVLSNQVKLLLIWIFVVLLGTQPAHSKLASYILSLFPAVAILFSYYIHVALKDEIKHSFLKSMISLSGTITGILFLVISIAIEVAATKYPEFIDNILIVHISSCLLLVLSTIILINSFGKKYLNLVFTIPFFIFILLFVMFSGKNVAEPWVSCKQICDVFKKIDQSNSVVLTSKFYLRGVRYYTDRKMAVIDINGKGFFSPHPIPFLNNDQMVLDFLATQEITYGIVKIGNLQDLQRILKSQPYSIQEFDNIGGKYIIKIERL